MKNGLAEVLVKLRNPDAESVWTGDWCYGSLKWSPELKELFNVTGKKDGTFCMPLRAFIDHFEFVDVCTYEEEYTFSSHQIEKISYS